MSDQDDVAFAQDDSIKSEQDDIAFAQVDSVKNCADGCRNNG